MEAPGAASPPVEFLSLEGLLFFRFHWVSDALEEVDGGRATGGWTGDVVVVIDSSQGFQAPETVSGSPWTLLMD